MGNLNIAAFAFSGNYRRGPSNNLNTQDEYRTLLRPQNFSAAPERLKKNCWKHCPYTCRLYLPVQQRAAALRSFLKEAMRRNKLRQ
jgi:hypothetical protein